jgi:hypothetical protein
LVLPFTSAQAAIDATVPLSLTYSVINDEVLRGQLDGNKNAWDFSFTISYTGTAGDYSFSDIYFGDSTSLMSPLAAFGLDGPLPGTFDLLGGGTSCTNGHCGYSFSFSSPSSSWTPGNGEFLTWSGSSIQDPGSLAAPGPIFFSANGFHNVSGHENEAGFLIDMARAQQVAAPVPEPETYAMMMAGLGMMGFIVRRRRSVSV